MDARGNRIQHKLDYERIETLTSIPTYHYTVNQQLSLTYIIIYSLCLVSVTEAAS